MTIQLFAWDTPNGRKISIALEEMGLSYDVSPIDITKDEQHKPEFLAISLVEDARIRGKHVKMPQVGRMPV